MQKSRTMTAASVLFAAARQRRVVSTAAKARDTHPPICLLHASQHRPWAQLPLSCSPSGRRFARRASRFSDTHTPPPPASSSSDAPPPSERWGWVRWLGGSP
jgi:hypothetical protein